MKKTMSKKCEKKIGDNVDIHVDDMMVDLQGKLNRLEPYSTRDASKSCPPDCVCRLEKTVTPFDPPKCTGSSCSGCESCLDRPFETCDGCGNKFDPEDAAGASQLIDEVAKIEVIDYEKMTDLASVLLSRDMPDLDIDTAAKFLCNFGYIVDASIAAGLIDVVVE